MYLRGGEVAALTRFHAKTVGTKTASSRERYLSASYRVYDDGPLAVAALCRLAFASASIPRLIAPSRSKKARWTWVRRACIYANGVVLTLV
jgi:hypothetical protein